MKVTTRVLSAWIYYNNIGILKVHGLSEETEAATREHQPYSSRPDTVKSTGDV